MKWQAQHAAASSRLSRYWVCRVVLGHSGGARPTPEWGIGAAARGVADRLGADRFRRRGGHLVGFQPRRPRPPQNLLAVSALSAAVCTGAVASRQHRPRHGGCAEISHRDGPGGCLSGRDEVDGLVVGIHQSGAHIRCSAWARSRLVRHSPTWSPVSGHCRGGRVLLVAAALGVAGALIALALVRPGPHLAVGGGWNPRHALAIFADRRVALATIGYLGHMWELYALWTWLSMFFVAGRPSYGARGLPSGDRIRHLRRDRRRRRGRMPDGRLGIRPARTRRRRGRSAGGQRSCCCGSPLVFTAPTRPRGLPPAVGRGRHRRLRRVLHCAERDHRSPVRRDRADGTDRRRIPAHRADHPGSFPLIADLFGWRYAFLILRAGAAARRCRDVGLHCSSTPPTPVGNRRMTTSIRAVPIARTDGPALTHRS